MIHCKHYPACGGCSLLHFPYDEQLALKQLKIEALFPSEKERIFPIIGCKTPFYYRNKMEFSFSQNKAQQKFLGLILKKSKGRVFNLEECHLSSSWFSKTVENLRNWWESTDLKAYHFRSGKGCLRSVTLRCSQKTGQKLVMLTVSSDPQSGIKKHHLSSFVQAIGDQEVSVFLRLQQCRKGALTQFYELHLAGKEHLEEELTVLGKTFCFKISPTSFFQPNTAQAEVLYTEALKMATLHSESVVFDLYCGTATLGMVAACFVKKVIAIELNPHAVFDAQANARINQVSHLEVECGDVGALIEQKYSKSACDLVILDPPRSGLDAKAIFQVLALKPKQILYISCNPVTQAKNIFDLKGYQIKKIQPVDQFPHTEHIENIVLLDRIEPSK